MIFTVLFFCACLLRAVWLIAEAKEERWRITKFSLSGAILGFATACLLSLGLSAEGTANVILLATPSGMLLGLGLAKGLKG